MPNLNFGELKLLSGLRNCKPGSATYFSTIFRGHLMGFLAKKY